MFLKIVSIKSCTSSEKSVSVAYPNNFSYPNNLGPGCERVKSDGAHPGARRRAPIKLVTVPVRVTYVIGTCGPLLDATHDYRCFDGRNRYC